MVINFGGAHVALRGVFRGRRPRGWADASSKRNGFASQEAGERERNQNSWVLGLVAGSAES